MFFLCVCVFFRNAGLQCYLRITPRWPFMPALPTLSGKALLFNSSVSLERLALTPTILAVLCLCHRSAESKMQDVWEWSVKCSYELPSVVSSYLVHKGISVEVLRTMCLRHLTSITTFTLTGLHFYFHICFWVIFWDPNHKQGFGSTQKECRVKIWIQLKVIWRRQSLRFMKTVDIEVTVRWL